MLDPATDDPGREWCYLAKSTTMIGVPYQPDVTQVTYDVALYTRNAELCFFYGKPLRPLLARQKTFLEGWMPIVLYDWSDRTGQSATTSRCSRRRWTWRKSVAMFLDTEKRNLPAPLSFDLVLEAFRHEYARRYAEFIKAGGKPTLVAAPPLSTAK
jgi:hypothetical protein